MSKLKAYLIKKVRKSKKILNNYVYDVSFGYLKLDKCYCTHILHNEKMLGKTIKELLKHTKCRKWHKHTYHNLDDNLSISLSIPLFHKRNNRFELYEHNELPSYVQYRINQYN